MLEAGKQKVKLQDDKQDREDKRNIEVFKTMNKG
jgi:hypothetical protein